jgi:hypothetical protein
MTGSFRTQPSCACQYLVRINLLAAQDPFNAYDDFAVDASPSDFSVFFNKRYSSKGMFLTVMLGIYPLLTSLRTPGLRFFKRQLSKKH